MIKRVKQFGPQAKINSPDFRNFAEKSESEILRGISTLAVLKVIANHGNEGIHGYGLLKELLDGTKNMLVIEEGTLYPLLKKLEKEALVRTEHKETDGRPRKNYYLTEEGFDIQRHLEGFFSKLIESLGDILGISVDLKNEHFLYCPNCANKIDRKNTDARFCEICGLDISNLIFSHSPDQSTQTVHTTSQEAHPNE